MHKIKLLIKVKIGKDYEVEKDILKTFVHSGRAYVLHLSAILSDKKRKYSVSDYQTGGRVGLGNTQKAAINNAIKAIDEHPDFDYSKFKTVNTGAAQLDLL